MSWWSGFESPWSRLNALFGWHDLVFAIREQVGNIPSNHWPFTSSVISLLSTANILINSGSTTKTFNLVYIIYGSIGGFLSIERGSLFSIFFV